MLSRPSHFVRYILVAALILIVLWTFRSSSQEYARPAPALTPATPYTPKTDTQKPYVDASRPKTGSDETQDGPLRPGSSGQHQSASGDTKSGSAHDTSSKPPSSSGSAGRPTHDSASPSAVPESPHKAPSGDNTPTAGDSFSGPENGHPIDKLIFDAQRTFAELTSKETKSLELAAQAYRKRRGRHPPPGFDKWFEFARNTSSVIIEDFFDQIYHDLEPFWGMDPALMRKEAGSFEMTINVRNGNATTGSDWFWTKIWHELIHTIDYMLPDMDIPLNAMDEPRLVVPWEDIDSYMQKAAKTVNLPKANTVSSDYQRLPAPGSVEPDVQRQEKTWENAKPYWPFVREGCAPSSPARTAPLQKSFAEPPVINDTYAAPHMYEGYVSNYTLSTEVCHQPDLQGLEGILIQPLSMSATKTLFPLFGGSKLAVNNEILLPAPMYWNEEERFTGGDDHGISWQEKGDKVIWRGVATGGLNKPDNWRGFQRHRFVAMNNGTKLADVEKGTVEAENFVMPEEYYGLSAQKGGKMGEWVNEWADVAFVDLFCVDTDVPEPCNYTSHYFQTMEGLKMVEQFDYKYLPDIDGNSFSGRYLGFLRSTSVPIKAAMWREWHDSRLVPWKHFIPMDNRFNDYYGIMEYFLGYEGHGAHDRAAEKIASDGKEWAEQVLRKEDMQLYVLRLLLEYGRITDDRREKLGFVEDVLANPSLEKIWSSWW